MQNYNEPDAERDPLRFELIARRLALHERGHFLRHSNQFQWREERGRIREALRQIWEDMTPDERLATSMRENRIHDGLPDLNEPESEPDHEPEAEMPHEPEAEAEPDHRIPDENANEMRRPRRTNRTVIPDFFDHRLRQRVGIIPRDDNMEETISI